MIPKAGSKGEAAFALHCKVGGLSPEREFRFHPDRKWRADFAFPAAKLLIEIEGGTWNSGRHIRGAGYEKDLEKNNSAVKLGWRVLRFTTGQVLNGTAINDVTEVLNGSV